MYLVYIDNGSLKKRNYHIVFREVLIMSIQPIKTDICPFCNEPVNLDKAHTHPQTKQLCHLVCLQNSSPARPTTGRFQSGSQKFHNSAARRGAESFCDAMGEISSRND